MTDEEVMVVCIDRLELAVKILKSSYEKGDYMLAGVACDDLRQGATILVDNIIELELDKSGVNTSTFISKAVESMKDVIKVKKTYKNLMAENNVDLDVRLADYVKETRTK